MQLTMISMANTKYENPHPNNNRIKIGEMLWKFIWTFKNLSSFSSKCFLQYNFCKRFRIPKLIARKILKHIIKYYYLGIYYLWEILNIYFFSFFFIMILVYEEVAPKKCNRCSRRWTHLLWKEEEVSGIGRRQFLRWASFLNKMIILHIHKYMKLLKRTWSVRMPHDFHLQPRLSNHPSSCPISN